MISIGLRPCKSGYGVCVVSDDFNPTEWITTGEAAELMGYSPVKFSVACERGKNQGPQARSRLVSRQSVLSYAKRTKDLGQQNTPSQEARLGTLLNSFLYFRKMKCYN
jgi:hypothetical protein